MDHEKYYVAFDKTEDTLLIAKKSIFNVPKHKDLVFKNFNEEQMKEMEFLEYEGVAFMFVDQFILIAVHLSSKA